MSKKVIIPPRGSYANRFNCRTLELGEHFDILEQEYTDKWAGVVGNALRYYESTEKGRLFEQRKWPHPSKKDKFIIRIYRSA